MRPIDSGAVSFVILLFVLLLVLPRSSASPTPPSVRRLSGVQRSNSSRQIPNCSGMASRSQCSQNPKCKWCRSDALDDMCFRKLEAWKLPQQVFVCD
ncbi:unnamed protein product [Linum trigynum]|uniref:Uncharacterized protein n=1 Tax=Linum trigynum TaxID=586398 RepID=A0AAV2FR34_9ROSI